MAIHQQTDLDYLIEDLRLYLGDMTTPYSFEDTDLRHALVLGLKALSKRWRYRYKIDSDYNVTRNSTADFAVSKPPVIESADDYPIVVQSAIILKEAEIKDSIWDIGSWRDDEISYSNIQGSKQANQGVERDEARLDAWFKKRLFGADRQSLEGFRLPLNQREGYV